MGKGSVAFREDIPHKMLNSSELHLEQSHVIGAALATLFLTFSLSLLNTWRRLRHIPGPTLSWLGSSWLIKNAVTGATSPNSAALSRYGSLVRMGPNAVATDDPDVVRRISRSPYTKSIWYTGFRMDNGRDNMFTLMDQNLHDKIKAKTAYAMAGKDGVDLDSGINVQVLRLLGIIRSKHLATAEQHRVMDLAPLIRYFTSDVFTSLFSGKEFGFMDADDLWDVGKLNDQVMAFLSLLCDLDWLRAVMQSRFLLFLQPRSTDEVGIGKVHGVTKKLVETRFQKNAFDNQDILGSFMRNGMGLDECYRQCLIFLFAGGDTTAATLRGILMFTMTTPRAYQSLKQEIRQAVAGGDISSPITVSQAKKLPFLSAVIYEGIRLRPAGTLGHPRIAPPEGDTIEGFFIPGNTAVYVNWIAMQLRKDVFGQDVDIFRPERFLKCNKEKKAEMERTVEMSFGAGKYQCAGKVIAFAEIYKVVFELFRHFDFQIANPSKPWEEQSWVNWTHHKMMVRITEDEHGKI